MVDLVTGCPFVYICKFGLGQSYFSVHVFFLDVCLQVAYSVHMGTRWDLVGVMWVVCIRAMLVGLSRMVPSFASWSTISLPNMPMCAMAFCIVILCVDHVIWLTIAAMSGLVSEWL